MKLRHRQPSEQRTTTDRSRILAISAICLTVFIDMIGVGLIIPVIPNLLQEISPASVAETAKIGGWLLFVYAAFQTLCGPVAGRLSDQFGRRPVLIIALAGLCIDYFIMFNATSLMVLFIGRALSGAFGSTFPVATAYMSDISTDEDRTKYFGYIEAAAGLGLIFGPAIGGILGGLDPRYPFFAAALLTFANLLSIFLFVPESLRPSDGVRSKQKDTFQTIKNFCNTRNVLLCLLAFFLFELAAQSIPSVWSFYAIERMSWSPQLIGYSIATFGFLVALVQSIFLSPIIQRFGNSRTVFLGALMSMIGYLALVYSTQPYLIVIGMVAGAFGTVIFPTIKSIAADNVSSHEQGQLQGLLSSLTSISVLVGVLIMTQIFSIFGSQTNAKVHNLIYFPGAPFVLSSAIFALSLLVIVRISDTSAVIIRDQDD